MDQRAKKTDGESPISLMAGNIPPQHRGFYGNSFLHQLMLTYINDPSKIDDNMKWQDKFCYGYTVQRTGMRLSINGNKVYGTGKVGRS